MTNKLFTYVTICVQYDIRNVCHCTFLMTIRTCGMIDMNETNLHQSSNEMFSFLPPNIVVHNMGHYRML